MHLALVIVGQRMTPYELPACCASMAQPQPPQATAGRFVSLRRRPEAETSTPVSKLGTVSTHVGKQKALRYLPLTTQSDLTLSRPIHTKPESCLFAPAAPPPPAHRPPPPPLPRPQLQPARASHCWLCVRKLCAALSASSAPLYNRPSDGCSLYPQAQAPAVQPRQV